MLLLQNIHIKKPSYLLHLIPRKTSPSYTCSKNHIPFQSSTFFRLFFQLQLSNRVVQTQLSPMQKVSAFKKHLKLFKKEIYSKTLRPSPNSFYYYHHLLGLNLLPSCLWVFVTCENINSNSFPDSSTQCVTACNRDAGSILHFLIYCPIFITERQIL